MGKILKTLCLIVVLAALGVGGFYAGQKLQGASETVPHLRADDFIPRGKPLHADNAPFATQPTVGPISRTVILPKLVAGAGADAYTATLPIAQAGEISAGQDVVFYGGDNNALLPLASRVVAVDADDQNARVTIALPAAPDTQTPAPAWARIVVMESVGKRVPRNALFTDEGGNAYVWKALQNDPEHFTIVRHAVFAGIQGDDYIEVGPELTKDDYIVANPPADLQDGEVRTLFVRTLNAPRHGYAEQARIHGIEQTAHNRYLELAAFQAATTPGGIAACPANISTDGLPADILAIPPMSSNNGNASPVPGAAPNGASAGCGSCSAAASAPVDPNAPAPANDPNAAGMGSGGGCGSCGTTYGGPPPADAPATTQ